MVFIGPYMLSGSRVRLLPGFCQGLIITEGAFYRGIIAEHCDWPREMAFLGAVNETLSELDTIDFHVRSNLCQKSLICFGIRCVVYPPG